MAAYRPAAAALGATLIAGAVSNALLSTLTSWTAERFAGAPESPAVHQDRVQRPGGWPQLTAKVLHSVLCSLALQPIFMPTLVSNCLLFADGCCIPFVVDAQLFASSLWDKAGQQALASVRVPHTYT